MEKVKVRLRKRIDDSYLISIDDNLLSKIPATLKQLNIGNKYLIISDSNVGKLYGLKLLKTMKKQGLNTELIGFKAGESSKNIETLGKLLQKTQDLGLDRKSAIIALGGGVTGDIAGLVAATYMRGINYIQIPTSLLAMVDSSIGGKVAVDLPTGKNIIGSFHQPKAVFIDVSLLKTLPKKEILCGLAEMIKQSLIADKNLFDKIDRNIDLILSNNSTMLIELIKRNCEIKSKIVSKDEKERNIRKLLNYGHTIGHAIETLTGYKKISHGEAVAIGMVVEGKIANKLGMLSNIELDKQNDLLKKAGFKTTLPELDTNIIIKELKKDKKVTNGNIEFVLLNKVGKARHNIRVENKIIAESLEN